MRLTRDPTTSSTKHLTKHHGWGNEYLVVLDEDGRHAPSSSTVRRLCNPTRGIGADGLVQALPASQGGADAAMNLYNADGSEAEMSGNGIRCLAQALLLAGWADPPDVAIDSRAGRRVVSVVAGPVDEADGTTTHILAADMGHVHVTADAPEWAMGPSKRAVWATAGNPHLVVEVDDHAGMASVDLVTLGERVNAATPGGANVNLVAPGPGSSAITVHTYERGVGITQACGTGASASAVAAAAWGLVGAPDSDASEQAGDDAGTAVTVHMLGGQGTVVLGTTVRLVGPVSTRRDRVFEYPGS
jgi:diaminopimelate epimerase